MDLALEAGRLENVVARIFEAAGCDAEEAGTVAVHLVLANLVGHDSHGVIRLRDYLPWIETGMVRPNRRAAVVFETPASALIDGDLGFGQAIGETAMAIGIAKAHASGIALIGVRNTGHLGRIGHWAERAAAADLISLHFVNTSGFGMLVGPFGSREARLSANPFAAGVPRPGDPPIILDMSTASIAEGKIKVALNAGKELPPATVIDASGNLTRDPQAFYRPPRGAILPFGGHKGYGLSVIVDVLAGALTGGGCTDSHRGSAGSLVNNMCSILIGRNLLGSSQAFAAEGDRLVAWIQSAAPMREDDGILLPGDLERRTREQRSVCTAFLWTRPPCSSSPALRNSSTCRLRLRG